MHSLCSPTGNAGEVEVIASEGARVAGEVRVIAREGARVAGETAVSRGIRRGLARDEWVIMRDDAVITVDRRAIRRECGAITGDERGYHARVRGHRGR